MHDRVWSTRLLGALAISLVLLTVGACGSSGAGTNATQLLQETFSGAHKVSSGDLTFSLTVTPTGSSVLTQPITLTFGGPFQSLGKGKLPQSNFTVTIGAQGRSGSLGILSTGTAGYVTLQGTSYQLPAPTFQRLESSFSQIGGGSGASNLTSLGIHPLRWLSNPSVVGTESVGGATTTHIRAGLNVPALLVDINTFLHKASTLSSSAKVPSGISSTSQARIAGEIKNATVDVWTGNNDKTIRKLAINLNLPVTGQISTQLGGLSAAGLGLSMEYDNLNQPQTIVAPTNAQPYSLFASKVRTFLQALQSGLLGNITGTGGTSAAGGSASGSASGSTGGSASGSTGGSQAGAPANAQAYAKCLQAAAGDISKLQKCASLLNGK